MNPENIIRAWVAVFALALLIISILAYKRSKNPKLILIGIAFLLFFVKGFLLSLELFFWTIEKVYLGSFAGLFDLGILLILFVATLRKV